MNRFISHSVRETEEFSEKLAGLLSGGEVIALFGGMGMGKTAFTRGLCRGLGYQGEVSSPTFAIVHEYRGGRLPVFHFDMYRITGWDDLETTAYFEYLEAGGVVVIEWSENIEAALPEDALRITIEAGGPEERHFFFSRELPLPEPNTKKEKER